MLPYLLSVRSAIGLWAGGAIFLLFWGQLAGQPRSISGSGSRATRPGAAIDSAIVFPLSVTGKVILQSGAGRGSKSRDSRGRLWKTPGQGAGGTRLNPI